MTSRMRIGTSGTGNPTSTDIESSAAAPPYPRFLRARSAAIFDWATSTTLPLSKTLWVDPGTTVPFADQNGSVGAPFSTAQRRISAATDYTTVVLQAADYTGEGPLTAPAIAELNLICLSPGLTTATLGPLNAPGLVLSCFGVKFVGDVTVSSLWCQFGAGVLGNVVAPNSANFVDQGYLVGTVTTSWLSAIHSDVWGGGAADSVYAISSGLPDSLNVNGYVELVSCWWNPGGGTWTFTGAPGQMILDAYSNWSWKTTASVLVNGVKVIAGDLVP